MKIDTIASPLELRPRFDHGHILLGLCLMVSRQECRQRVSKMQEVQGADLQAVFSLPMISVIDSRPLFCI